VKNLVILSGGFDPIHMGHVYMIEAASLVGEIAICLNSDDWLIRKKSKPFMSWIERATIVRNMKYVIDVLPMNDDDDTACDGIKSAYTKYKKKRDCIYFGNGGDRNALTVPSKEQELCNKLGIRLLWELGGDAKVQSSSWVLDK
jgi:D-beta-D-heptose 7-phosphate kinase/D-beta-D-heptose 1-phosphate adenosyltransferase